MNSATERDQENTPHNEQPTGGAKGEERSQTSILAGPERAVLDWLIPRLPLWITPDILTGGALAAMAVAGFAYSRASDQPWMLHVVNGCLFLHWLGDSMDGGLARARNQSRPRYGFYVDHMCDALGAFFVSVGAFVSGIVTPWIAALILSLYLLLSAHSYLALYATGVFRLSYGWVGPTELRLAVVICNLFVIWKPTTIIANSTFLTFDLVGGITALALTYILVSQVALTTLLLHRREPIRRQRRT